MPAPISRVSSGTDFGDIPLNVQTEVEPALSTRFERAEPKPSDQLASVEQRKEIPSEMSWTEWGHYALGVIDAFNPLTPLAESIASDLGLEADRPPEYWQGRVEGGNAALVVDVAIMAGGSAMIGGSATCEVATVGICTPVAGAGALTGGAVALAGGGLMAIHGSGVERAKGKYLESRGKDQTSSGSGSHSRTSDIKAEKTSQLSKEPSALQAADVWTSTKLKSASENVLEHWTKHASEFPEFKNVEEYAKGAKDFLHHSPQGTLTKLRPNGDVLKYHSETNTFGVMDRNGSPRTLFRPEDGMAYWLEQ